MPAKIAIVQARERRWDADLTLVIIDFIQRVYVRTHSNRFLDENPLQRIVKKKGQTLQKKL